MFRGLPLRSLCRASIASAGKNVRFGRPGSSPDCVASETRQSFPCESVHAAGVILEHEIFHARVSLLLSGLAEKHHQNDPLDLLDIDVGGLQR